MTPLPPHPTPENRDSAALAVVKEAVLDAGMRITTAEKNKFQPRNRKRTEAHHGTEAKATGEGVQCPVQVEQRKDVVLMEPKEELHPPQNKHKEQLKKL